jgi:hypothetical protein
MGSLGPGDPSPWLPQAGVSILFSEFQNLTDLANFFLPSRGLLESKVHEGLFAAASLRPRTELGSSVGAE